MVTELGSIIEQEDSSKVVWNEVVFGHYYHDFDRDQYLTHWLARQAGLVDESADVNFQPYATPAEEDNSHTLVIEGLRPTAEINQKNKRISRRNSLPNPGNWDNGPSGEPTAWMFWQSYRNEIIENSDYSQDQLDGLMKWFNQVEKGTDPKSTNAGNLNTSKLSQAFHHVFYGIKAGYIVSETAGDFIQTMDQVVATALADSPTESFTQAYGEHVATSQSLEAQVKQQTREFIDANPDKIKITEVSRGQGETLRMAYVDARGLDNPRSTAGIAFDRTKADIAMIVSDEINDANEVVGSKMVWQLNREVENQQIDQDGLNELADRLSETEMLFGRDYQSVTFAPFGGHAESVLSPRGGSQLEPERLWLEVQQYFGGQRLSVEDMQQLALEVSTQIPGLENVVTGETKPDQKRQILERFLRFQVLDGETPKTVDVSEADMEIYTSLFKADDAAYNQELLRQKTDFSEHPDASKLRTERAQENIARLLEIGDAGGILIQLETLSPESIQALPAEQLLKVWEVVSQDTIARAQVWDKGNLSFRIAHNPLPGWIINNPDHYAAARYRYRSVPQKVDTFIAETLQKNLVSVSSAEDRQHFGNSIINIVSSKEYQRSHQDGGYDQLLQTALRFALNPQVEIGQVEQFVNKLIEVYGSDMQEHWNQVARTDPGLILQAVSRFSALEKLHLDLAVESLQNVPEAFVAKPSKEKIEASIRRQREQGLEQSYVTILVDIGGRDNTTILRNKGVNRIEQDSSGHQQHEEAVEPDAVFGCKRGLQLDLEHLEQHKIATAVLDLLIDTIIASPSEAKIRIVKGSLPGIQQESLGEALGTMLTSLYYQHSEVYKLIENRLVMTDYYIQDERWWDHPLNHQIIEDTNARIDELAQSLTR